ncbi:MAG TPA: PA14 domain-containing protein [Methylomirabilota bacterium]|nr:PA14 domain-containing protein [Methylomirabilota bacterium]
MIPMPRVGFTPIPVLIAALLAFTAAAAPITGPTVEQTAKGIRAGELLLGELNCVACHKAEASVTERLNPRTAPILSEVGDRVTVQELRKWIADPHTAKPGTTMPDMLRQLPSEKRTEAAEDLTHFLASLKSGAERPGHMYDELKARQGKALYHKVGCVACHAPQSAASEFNPALPSGVGLSTLLVTNSAPFPNLARKYTVQSLSAFLLDPLKARPSGRMPSLKLFESEAVGIAMYLLREQSRNTPSGEPERIAGLAYAYSEEGVSEDPDFYKLPIKETGSTEIPSVKPAKRESNFAIRFSGYIRIERSGRYTFYTHSDDGSRLFIGEQMVVNNWGFHAAQEKSGTVELAAGDHPITILFYQGGGESELRVSYAGPGIQKQSIPSSMFSHEGRPMRPLESGVFALEPERVGRGRELFTALGCAACHDIGAGVRDDANARSLASLQNVSGGCLAENPAAKAADYRLSSDQRQALREALEKREELAKPLAAAARVTRTLAALNCYACHTRDGEGGPTAARLDYFVTLGEAELGDEGRVPPHLTKVGAKLKPEWAREVIVNGGAARPYMATRMPQFGERNAGHLPQSFEQADVPSDARPEPQVSANNAKLGRKLVGTGALSCVSCHTFAPFKSLGIPAVDLTQMSKRLKYDWFHRYLIDPQSLRPNTRMPTFWPNGEAANKEILGGNTDAQIAAIWAYLSEGTEASPPDGLIQGKREIVAAEHPVIYRHFIEGAGTRAIGVGYPEKVNLAFDAQNLRLALLWHGPFIDSSRHSTGRGEGFEGPLGHNILKLPNGPSVAMLPDSQAAWPEKADAANARFLGYKLDEKQRPAFRYSVNGMLVEEFFEPVPGELDPLFIRHIFTGRPTGAQMFVRLGVSDNVTSPEPNVFILNKKLQLRVTGAQATTRQSGGRTEILAPLTPGQESKISVQMGW